MSTGTSSRRWAIRGICVAYWIYLTGLLLVPHPEALVPGLSRRPDLPYVHVYCFIVLAILVHASRFRWWRLTAVAALVAYGIITESLQNFVPPRHAQVSDAAQNILGIAIGTALWWTASKILRRRRGEDDKARG